MVLITWTVLTVACLGRMGLVEGVDDVRMFIWHWSLLPFIDRPQFLIGFSPRQLMYQKMFFSQVPSSAPVAHRTRVL